MNEAGCGTGGITALFIDDKLTFTKPANKASSGLNLQYIWMDMS